MIESKEILEKVDKEWGELKEEEVVAKMISIVKTLHNIDLTVKDTDNYSISTLVDWVWTLCKYMDNLSALKEHAYIRAEALGEEYKSKVREEYLNIKTSGEKITDGMAKAQAEAKCDSIKQEELVAIHQARRLKDFYDNANRLVNFTQTKVKSTDDSRIRHNIPNN